jgi:hypothetical protein
MKAQLVTATAILAGLGIAVCHANEADAATPAPAHIDYSNAALHPHVTPNGDFRTILTNRPHRIRTFKPCEYEDSVGCWWDASEGNGLGNSFVAVLRHGYTCLAFLDPTYAQQNDRCIEGDVNTP